MNHTDGDLLAFLDAHRVCIQVGERISHSAIVEFGKDAWELRIVNGPDIKLTKHSSLREALKVLHDSDIPTGDGVKCFNCNAELDDDEERGDEWIDPICDTCAANQDARDERFLDDPRHGQAEGLNAANRRTR